MPLVQDDEESEDLDEVNLPPGWLAETTEDGEQYYYKYKDDGEAMTFWYLQEVWDYYNEYEADDEDLEEDLLDPNSMTY